MFPRGEKCKRRFKAVYTGIFTLLLFTLPFIAFSQSPQCGDFAKFYRKDSLNVTLFGASTVQGFPIGTGFHVPLRRFIQTCYPGVIVDIDNRGIYGQTTTQGLARLDEAIENKTGFLLILMGANDVIQMAEGRMRMNTTFDNITQMIIRAKEKKLDVILGTLQYFREIPGNSPEARRIRFYNYLIDMVNAGYKRIAANNGVRIADINGTLGKMRQFYADDIHLNPRGYHIGSLVWFDAINQEVLNHFLDPGITQNFPNPSTGLTRIGIAVPSAVRITIRVFDIAGRVMSKPIDEFRNAGYYEQELNTSGWAPGLYFIHVNILGKSYVKKMLVSK